VTREEILRARYGPPWWCERCEHRTVYERRVPAGGKYFRCDHCGHVRHDVPQRKEPNR